MRQNGQIMQRLTRMHAQEGAEDVQAIRVRFRLPGFDKGRDRRLSRRTVCGVTPMPRKIPPAGRLHERRFPGVDSVEGESPEKQIRYPEFGEHDGWRRRGSLRQWGPTACQRHSRIAMLERKSGLASCMSTAGTRVHGSIIAKPAEAGAWG